MTPSTTPAPPTSAPGPEITSTTDNLPVPIAITTPPLRQKRKLNPLSPPEPGKRSSAIQKQCVLQEFYNPQSWYNTPAFSQTSSLHTFKPSTLSPHPLEPSTMAALRMKIKGFAILTNDEYVKLAATINKQLQVNISDVNLEVVTYHFALERNGRGTNSTNKPTAKRPKNEVLDNSKYAELSTAFSETYRSNISCKDIAFMDITLQNHRAVNMATQLMNNPVVDITGDHQNSGPPAEAAGTKHAAANRTTVTPTAVPSIKKETTHTSSRRTLFNKQRSPLRTFEWQSKPTNERNHCIDTAAFINTLPTVFPTAQTTINLDCTYTNNPRATLETLLKILDANVPQEFMDTMFATDHTVSPNTIDSIFRKHNVGVHF
jgi:hypothetical protein